MDRRRLVWLFLTGLSSVSCLSISRRDVCRVIAGTSPAIALVPRPSWAASDATAPQSHAKVLARRFSDSILKQPPIMMGSGDGIDNTYFPDFLAGDWRLTQTLVDIQAPLGSVYMGGPNGRQEIAQQSLQESRARIGKPVELNVRYVTTKWGVAEDRLANTQARLDTFAGRPVVAGVAYADVGASNRAAMLAAGGTEDDPLSTVFVRFRGPAAQKTFLTGHGAAYQSPSHWFGWEGQRSIFALTNQSTAPPVFTDSELLWEFTKIDDNHIQGRLRIAGYLNAQSDKLYFDARNRAVSIQDYALDMRRI